MANNTFDPNEFTVTVGAHIVSGFAEGVFIEIELPELYNSETDSQGGSYRFKINNNDVPINITLAQGSPSNDYFSYLMNLDKTLNAGIVPFMAKDNLGTSLYSCKESFIVNPSKPAYGTSGQNRVWTLIARKMNVFVGGMND